MKGQSAPSDARGDQAVPSEGGESQGPSATELIEQRAAREKQFEAAVETARARVQEIEQQANTLRERLNPMSTTFVYGAGGTLDVNEEHRIRAELQQLPTRLEEAKRG